MKSGLTSYQLECLIATSRSGADRSMREVLALPTFETAMDVLRVVILCQFRDLASYLPSSCTASRRTHGDRECES